jgi:hypothetical protein
MPELPLGKFTLASIGKGNFYFFLFTGNHYSSWFGFISGVIAGKGSKLAI